MPGPYAWSARSRACLDTCHPLLITLFDRVLARADLPHDLSAICGHRARAEQNAAVASGASRLHWPRSAHNKRPSLAVDVVPFVDRKQEHEDADVFARHAPAVKAEWAAMQAAGLVPDGVRLVWGGDWGWDSPHWQLDGLR